MIELQRMPKKERKRMLLELQYYSPTEKGLTDAVTDGIRSVRTVTWRRGEPGTATASLRMRWWAWLALGALHVLALKQARRIIDRHKPASVMIEVSAW